MMFLIVAGCLSACVSADPSFYGLVAHPNGAVFPVDEPAVAAARADHHHAGGAPVYAPGVHATYAAPAVAAPAVHAAYAAAPAAYAAVPAVPAAVPAHYGLVAHPNGAVVPVDEPAVAEARAAHLTALAHAGH